jgi:hypothetical protein
MGRLVFCLWAMIQKILGRKGRKDPQRAQSDFWAGTIGTVEQE